MKNKYFFILLLGVLLVISSVMYTGCTTEVIDTSVEEETETPPIEYENVSAQEAYALLEKNRDNQDFIIIDIRTPEEYAEGHLENAGNIDFLGPDFAEQIDKLDREKTYLVYCRSGTRSGNSMPLFKEKGFRNIYHMNGGIIEWTGEELPLVE